MKICYLADSINVHDLRFQAKLVENGYEVHTVTFYLEPVEVAGVTYHRIPYPDYYFRSPRKLWITRRAFRRVLREVRPDILHAGWIPTHGFVAAVSGFHPFLLMPWGSDILLMPRQAISNRLITRFTLRRADLITCDAQSVKKEILRLSAYPPQKIIVFPWGPDMKLFNPSVDGSALRHSLGWEANKVLVMTRSLEPVYGIEYFLRSLPGVLQAHPETRVLLCGDGSLRGHYEDWVKAQGLAPYVHFAGRVAPEELAHYLRAGDIYVSSSLSDGTSVALLEAMACALPVVVTDVPANQEWVRDGENGFVAPRRDAHALGEKVVKLLGDEGRRREFGARNLEIARQRADWDRNFEVIEDMYRMLAKSRVRR